MTIAVRSGRSMPVSTSRSARSRESSSSVSVGASRQCTPSSKPRPKVIVARACSPERISRSRHLQTRDTTSWAARAGNSAVSDAVCLDPDSGPTPADRCRRCSVGEPCQHLLDTPGEILIFLNDGVRQWLGRLGNQFGDRGRERGLPSFGLAGRDEQRGASHSSTSMNNAVRTLKSLVPDLRRAAQNRRGDPCRSTGRAASQLPSTASGLFGRRHPADLIDSSTWWDQSCGPRRSRRPTT
jgi:hypothetical protein